MTRACSLLLAYHGTTRPSQTKRRTIFNLAEAARSTNTRGRHIEVDYGHEKRRLFVHKTWLRDVCPCPQCVDPHSGQKRFSTADLDPDPDIRDAALRDDGTLRIKWGPTLSRDASTCRHVSEYSAELLERLAKIPAYEADTPGKDRDTEIALERRRLWNRSVWHQVLASKSTVSFADWTKGIPGAAFWDAFKNLCQNGLIVVKDVPRSENAVERVAQAVGETQDTFYGRTWDVRTKPNAENVAYTSEFLDLHQDLNYMSDRPRLQFLHCLDNTCAGGESFFCDGLAVASLQHSRRLTEWPAVFHYVKDREKRHKRVPILETDETGTLVTRVNWAPQFQGPQLRGLSARPTLSLDDKPTATWGRCVREVLAKGGGHDPFELWLDSIHKFQRLASTPEQMIEFKTREGDCVVFDNHRILHGRRQFRCSASSSTADRPQRWLKGCYVSDAVFTSKLRRSPHFADLTCKKAQTFADEHHEPIRPIQGPP